MSEWRCVGPGQDVYCPGSRPDGTPCKARLFTAAHATIVCVRVSRGGGGSSPHLRARIVDKCDRCKAYLDIETDLAFDQAA